MGTPKWDTGTPKGDTETLKWDMRTPKWIWRPKGGPQSGRRDPKGGHGDPIMGYGNPKVGRGDPKMRCRDPKVHFKGTCGAGTALLWGGGVPEGRGGRQRPLLAVPIAITGGPTPWGHLWGQQHRVAPIVPIETPTSP